MKTLSLTLFLSIICGFGFAQSFRIDSLPKQGILLDKGWKWHAGDNPEWAKVDFDDSDWEGINPTKDLNDLSQIRQNPIGWFRIRFQIDSSLFNKPLTFQVSQAIASEIYLNGTLLKKYGKVSSKSNEIRGFLPQNFPIGTVFTQREQMIAVRFSVQPNLPYFKYVYPYIVFNLRINTIEGATQRQVNSLRNAQMRGFNTGMFLLLGLIHIIFYFNFRRKTAYLYFAIALISIGVGYLLSAFIPSESSLTFRAYLAIISYPLIFSFYGYFLYLAIWEMFSRRKNFMFWFLMFCAIIGPFVNVLYYNLGYLIGLMCPMLLCSLESARITYIAYQTNRKVGVILIGLIAYFTLFILFLLFLLRKIVNIPVSSWFVPNSWSLQDIIHWLSLAAIPFTLSWYLSKEYAFTSKNLAKKLEENLQLSEEKQQILSTQNETLEREVEARTAELVQKNRDLEIEGALEKVRSRSMAMHKSDELHEVIKVLFEQLINLNFKIDSAQFDLDYKKSDDFDFWTAIPSQTYPFKLHIPYFDHPFLNQKREAQDNGLDISVANYTFNEKNLYFQHVFKHNPLIPEERKKYILNCRGMAISAVLLKTISLWIGNYNATPFSEEENAVLKRFALVFEQAYIRFLDLQKAEAQTREAEIELALERVRSRTMAMQHSNELGETANLLFQQIQTLGIPAWSCGFNIWEKHERSCTGWMSSNGILQPPFKIPLTESQSFIRQYESKQKGEEFYAEEVGGEALAAHYQYMGSLPDFAEILKDFLKSGYKLPHFQINHVANFKHGSLIFITSEPVPDSWDIFKRFAKVFEQTYTRFLDLQKAEAQTEQANLDLIQIQTEKKRAEDALTILQTTQAQLIQSEKLASLGELTAGIAHEIQNPLNFVNNFSEMSVELAKELLEEETKPLTTQDPILKTELLNDLIQNQEKINHHGKRASSIVKGMLEHSRASTGVKELTDINALADEYLRLSYHGLRAKDMNGSTSRFNADFKTDFDENLPKIEIIPQDFGRVLLNLINNAFYAVKTVEKPLVMVKTELFDNQIIIKIKDNGIGMSEATKAKIFQPFFTTKPTGQGTGLGLSLAYDIITKGHNGTLEVETKEQEGTEFIINLPLH